MNKKYTPGPWRIGNQKSCIVSDSPDNISISGATGDENTKYYGGNLIGESISPANAVLISAAPDMLEALQNLENDNNSIPEHAWNLVQAAIKKATTPWDN